jgi:AhpD family alkylhydroperoxidase
MQSQLELLDEIVDYTTKLKQELPGAMAAHTAFVDEVYKDGALSSKVKRLMALAVALRAGCTACILYQTKMAVEAGATKAEVLETMSVARAMGGTPAGGWSWRVVKILEELGKW